jgi:hypothetical protein
MLLSSRVENSCLKVMSLCSFQAPGENHPGTQRDVTEDLKAFGITFLIGIKTGAQAEFGLSSTKSMNTLYMDVKYFYNHLLIQWNL